MAGPPPPDGGHPPPRWLIVNGDDLGLTARGFDRVRRVARTLADLEGSEMIGEAHVAEAVQYRGWQLAPRS